MGRPTGLSVREAAALSGYHPESIRRLIRERKIRAQKIGLMYFINQRSLEEYVRDMRDAPDRRRVQN